MLLEDKQFVNSSSGLCLLGSELVCKLGSKNPPAMLSQHSVPQEHCVRDL